LSVVVLLLLRTRRRKLQLQYWIIPRFTLLRGQFASKE
jgi:hypothetical protein